jgi:hypothetical protein
MNLLERIVIDPEICHGKPTLRGLRYPVEMILVVLPRFRAKYSLVRSNQVPSIGSSSSRLRTQWAPGHSRACSTRRAAGQSYWFSRQPR